MRDEATGTGTFDRLSDFVLGTRPEVIPEATRRTAALLILDTLGICAASAPMEAGRIGRETAARLFAAGSPEDSARMLFDGRPVSLAGAIYAAATQTDNLDAHDGFNPVKGHIGVVAVPALAVLAEALPGLRGAEALAATVVCYEVAGRAGLSLHGSVSDYHTSGAWNALGVAAMAARMRGLSPAMLREALGIAEYHGPRSQMMREIANPTMLHDGSGWGGLAGATAAMLAEAGFTGAPAITIEAPEAAPHWADLGQVWQTDEQYIKPYPICRWAHAAIDGARDLCRAHQVTADDIAVIRVASFQNAVALFPGMPETTSQAQYSLPFAVAQVILHGRIGVEHITGAALSDPRAAQLVDLISVEPDARHEARFPAGRFADVTFTLKDGRVLASGDVSARGGPDRPFGRDQIVPKFMDFAGPVLGARRADALKDAVLRLAEGGDFAAVAAELYAPL